MIEAGKVLQQRYKIDKQIGQGGMGAVYVATDERFGSIVAIKQTLLMDDSYRKAIEREARLLNSLKHTALPRVTDHFLEENGQFLVMEFIPGEDLGHSLERDAKPFPVETVLGWADQLLDALDFLHTQAIPVIHRDIKPQNLKVTPKGQIVLLDFGLAKGNPTDTGHQTAAKSIFGYSRSYASLEQIQGTGTDPRSDLYSLAATLHHLLTGFPPEDALTRAMALLSGQPDPLVPANRSRTEIPAGVAGILFRAMSLNAAERPRSASEMRAMFREPDRYSNFGSTAVPVSAKISPDLATQPTQILPGDTQYDGGKSTDVDAARRSDFDSEETRIRSTPRFADTGGRRSTTPSKRRRLLAALAAVLLLGVGGFCVYLFAPALLRHRSTGVDDTPANQPVAIANASNSNSPANLTTDAAAGTETEGGQAERVKTQNSPEKSLESKTRSTATVPPRSEDNSDTDPPVPPDVSVGNVRIHNGRVETPNVVVDENGVVRRLNGVPVVIPGLPPGITRQQLRQMTPEQRRQLRLLYRRNSQQHPIP